MEQTIHIVRLLIHENVIKTGDFVLKSGKKSKYYVDFRSLISKPKLFSQLASMLGNLLPNNKDFFLCGLPYAGIPYCVFISTHKEIPMIMLRKEQKKYGTRKMIEGNIRSGEEVVLIDDILTSGTSIIESLEYLKDYKVKKIVVILDRCEGGKQKLENMGFEVISLFKIDDFTKCQNTL